MQELVDNDQFLKKLEQLFESTRSSGGTSIWLTHKRLDHEGADTEGKMDVDDREYPCLLRATNGKDTTFSTHVDPRSLPVFHRAYNALLKSSMSQTLKKRDKKKEKQKAEEAAARKKRLYEKIIITGAKRGKGRRQRKRLQKAAIKQEAAIRRLESKPKASGLA